MAVILSIVLPLISSYAMASAVCQPKENSMACYLNRSFFSVGLFFGLTSCSYFMGRFLLEDFNAKYALFEALFYLILLFGMVTKSLLIANQKQIPDINTENESSKWNRVLGISFFLLLLLSLVVFTLAYLTEKHGWWDAWAIWNMRARFLHLGGKNWANAFSGIMGFSHLDYPLLIPAGIARIWHYFGNPSTLIPALTGTAFTLSTIGLLAASLMTVKGKTTGLLGGLILAGTYKFIVIGTYQIADVPLSFYFLGTVVAIAFFHYSESRRYLFMAGMMMGFAAWTKNEGILFVVVCLFSFSAVSLRRRHAINSVKDIIVIASGLAPVLMVLLIFKGEYAPKSDLFIGLDMNVALERIIDPSRHMAIVLEFMKSTINIGKTWLIVLPFAIVLTGTADLRNDARRTVTTSLLITALTALGYYSVYLITPYDPKWHLSHSLRRLIIHLWPTVLFIYCICLRTPELSGNGKRDEI